MKNIFLVILILCFVLFITPKLTYSVNTSNKPAADIQFWVRLDATKQVVDKQGNYVIELTTGTIAQKPNATIYIAECLDTTTDRVCSTGTEEGDKTVYQSTENLNKMKKQFGYKFTGMLDSKTKKEIKNPIQSDINGEIPTIILVSTIANNSVRKFYGVNIIKEIKEVHSLDELEKLGTGDEGGMQQGSFNAKIPTPTLKPKKVTIENQQGEAKPKCDDFGDQGLKCCSYNAADGCDPYGRIFDAISLEPIDNAKVSLLIQREADTFSFFSPKETTNAIINPWTTKEDGKYVFLVPSGTYRLDVKIPTHTFPFIPGFLNENYKKAYYELYYGPGYTDQNIVEVKVEHRDIPIIPKGEPYRSPVKLMGYMAELDKNLNTYTISGRTSHPLTIVEILGKNIKTNKNTRTLTTIQADKWGYFDTSIKTITLQIDETVGTAKLTKVDLTQSAPSVFNKIPKKIFSWIHNVNASSISVPTVSYASINPIMNYIEGYTYDTKKNTIPNATIGIYLDGSKKPYFETQSDENGYFSITSSHLPQINYSLLYTSNNNSTYQVKQAKFLSDNADVIKNNKINVNKYVIAKTIFKTNENTQNNQKEVKESIILNKPINTFNTQTDISKTDTSQKNNSKNSPTNHNLIYIIIVLLLVGTILGVVFFSFLRKSRLKNY